MFSGKRSLIACGPFAGEHRSLFPRMSDHRTRPRKMHALKHGILLTKASQEARPLWCMTEQLISGLFESLVVHIFTAQVRNQSHGSEAMCWGWKEEKETGKDEVGVGRTGLSAACPLLRTCLIPSSHFGFHTQELHNHAENDSTLLRHNLRQ